MKKRTINGCKYTFGCNPPKKNLVDWHQYLSFDCCPHEKTKKELLKKRDAIIHDIDMVFTKHNLKLTDYTI